jgi:hypothetical protein
MIPSAVFPKVPRPGTKIFPQLACLDDLTMPYATCLVPARLTQLRLWKETMSFEATYFQGSRYTVYITKHP